MATLVAPSMEDLKRTIRGVGLRSTAPRVAVLRKLSMAAAPVSHGELVDLLSSEGLDRTTVWRNLSSMTGAGLVQRTDLGDHVWRFELKGHKGRGSKHPHFTCTDCGAVSCLPEVALKVRRGRGVPRSLQRQQVEIQLRGVCDRCA